MRILICCILISVILCPTGSAMAERINNSAGDPCPGQLGVTKIDADSTGIIGCFATSKADSTLVWKAFTAASATQAPLCLTFRYNPNVSPNLSSTSVLPIGTKPADVVTGARLTKTSIRTFFPTIWPEYIAENNYFSGVKCLNGYSRSACTIATANQDNDTTMIENGCLTDDDETTNMTSGSGFYITCCK
ncbi:MAG: hypothetical protein PHD48_09445 [Alphaproteobacteria bacterium]|nr:hypothetical protein [Alphaproteobacteria bacterium]